MVGALVDLGGVANPVPLELGARGLEGLRRLERVRSAESDVELAADLADPQVRRIGPFGDDERRVQRRPGGEGLRERRHRADDEPAAEAEAHAALRPAARQRVALELVEDRARVAHQRLVVELLDQPEHPLHLTRLGVPELGAVEGDPVAEAVVEIRHGDVVARLGQAPADPAKLFTQPQRIHVDDDDRKRSALVGMREERRHRAVARADPFFPLAHRASSFTQGPRHRRGPWLTASIASCGR